MLWLPHSPGMPGYCNYLGGALLYSLLVRIDEMYRGQILLESGWLSAGIVLFSK